MPENLPDRLRIARTKLGLTVEQAAKAAGVTRKTWERYEKGGNDPQASSLISLIERGVNPQWLMTGRGEMMGPPINDVGPAGQAGAVDWELLWMISRQLELFREERRLNWSDERKFDLVRLGYEMMIKKRESGKEPEVEDFHYILRAAS